MLGLVGSMTENGSLFWRRLPPSLESMSPSSATLSGAGLVARLLHSWMAWSVPPSWRR
jgi:hypothetical protein